MLSLLVLVACAATHLPPAALLPTPDEGRVVREAAAIGNHQLRRWSCTDTAVQFVEQGSFLVVQVTLPEGVEKLDTTCAVKLSGSKAVELPVRVVAEGPGHNSSASVEHDGVVVGRMPLAWGASGAQRLPRAKARIEYGHVWGLPCARVVTEDGDGITDNDDELVSGCLESLAEPTRVEAGKWALTLSVPGR